MCFDTTPGMFDELLLLLIKSFLGAVFTGVSTGDALTGESFGEAGFAYRKLILTFSQNIPSPQAS